MGRGGYNSLIRFVNRIRLIKAYEVYKHQSLHYMQSLCIPNKEMPGEKEYKIKWSVLSNRVDVASYRLYSHYCGCIPEIVPEDIGRIIIEEKLNPSRYRDFYNDKSLYPVLLGTTKVPQTILCRINGSVILDASLTPLRTDVETACCNAKRVILKPSIDSSSGQGIEMFEYDNGKYINEKRAILTMDYLLNYSKNFVLQEVIKQHYDLARFNESSLNSIRIATYRSVKDEKSHVLSAILRMWKSGSCVDNAHAGGRYVGIDVKTGKLGNYTCDQYGNKSPIWNQVDFSNNTFYIPCWNSVVSLSKEISQKVYHHRLLALDLTVDKDGTPLLIEYNLGGFSYWLFEFTNQKPLGEFTDEIIDYCKL